MGSRLRVSSDSLDEPGIKPGTPGYKASGLTTNCGGSLTNMKILK